MIEAKKLKIVGFVKNESDGSVLIEAEGAEESIDLFCLSVERGPSWARVDGIQVQDIPIQDFIRFSVK
jgi:acylphosphatase